MATITAHKRPLCYSRKPFTGGTPKPTGSPAPRAVGSLLDRVDATVKMVYDDWRPINNLAGYVEIRRKRATTLDEHILIQKIINKHTEYFKAHPKPEEKPNHEEPQLSNVVNAEHPLAALTQRHLSPSETTETYKKAGYSDTFLENLQKKFGAREKLIATNNDYIDKVLVNYPGKSTTKKKKVPIRSRFAVMMKNKNKIMQEDLEDDEIKDEKKDITKVVDEGRGEGEAVGGNV